MRIVTIILSFYLLFLGTLSCDDAEADKFATDNIVLLKAPAQDDDHSHEQDDCSPFCICNCCHTACFVVEPPQLTAAVFQHHNFNFFYPDRFVSGDINNLFRPPKA